MGTEGSQIHAFPFWYYRVHLKCCFSLTAKDPAYRIDNLSCSVPAALAGRHACGFLSTASLTSRSSLTPVSEPVGLAPYHRSTSSSVLCLATAILRYHMLCLKVGETDTALYYPSAQSHMPRPAAMHCLLRCDVQSAINAEAFKLP